MQQKSASVPLYRGHTGPVTKSEGLWVVASHLSHPLGQLSFASSLVLAS